MTYVVSNVHGNYEKFKQLLININLKDSDVMYVLGDLLDYGDDPMGLILDISMRYNVLPVLGEREYNSIEMLTELDKMLNGETPDPSALSKMAEWMENGGKSTIDGFKALDKDMREGVLDYLADMALYEETTVKGKDYIMVNAGIADFDESADIDDYMPEDFISEPADPKRIYYSDKTLIVGHIPTSKYGAKDSIFYGESTIHIDCGVAFGGRLGCLRLEDGKEFYV